MSFWGPDQVERVKEAADLLAVMSRYVAGSPKKAGQHHVAKCCFHEDRTASLHIHEDHYYCFGCGAHGDAITAVQLKDGIPFQDAVEALALEFRVPLEDLSTPAAKAEAKALADERAPLYAAAELACSRYEAALWTDAGAAALDYLRQRGFSDDIIRSHRLGWADGSLVAAAYELAISEETLLRADLAKRRNDGPLLDRFWHRITVPILDHRRRVVSFSARLTDTDEARLKAEGKEVGKYINGTDTPIYEKGQSVFGLAKARQAAKDTKRFILVEGALDVLACCQGGYPEAFACLGTATTPDQAALIAAAAAGGLPVVVALDGDNAGKRARATTVPRLLATGTAVQVATLPGKDPAKLLCEQTDDQGGPAQFAKALDETAPGVEWWLSQLAPDPRKLDDAQRLGILDQVLHQVAGVTDLSYRNLVCTRAAKWLGVDARTARRRERAARGEHLADADGPGEGKPRKIACTDWGNAQRFLARCRGQVLYCREWQVFVLWNGSVWEVDDGEDSKAWVRYHAAMAESLAEEIATSKRTGDTERMHDLMEWRKASDSTASHTAALNHARRLAEWRATAADFDREPYLLNVRNGIVDLRTGELRPHDPLERMTRQVAADWKGDVADDRWSRFVDHLAGGAEVAAYLQRFAGYSATSVVREKAIVILQGDGDSGKTTYINALMRVMGTYASTLNAENFLQQQQTQKRWELANADHARFVSIEEVGTDGRGFAIDFLKSATGGNSITAEKKFGQPYSFTPVWKLLFVCNDAPLAPAGDNATWNRINLVRAAPPPAVLDRDLGDHLKSEEARSAILAWIVAGARDYLVRKGLDAPEAVRLATADHRADCDWLWQYLDEAWTIGGESDRVTVRSFMTDLHAWCGARGHKLPSARSVLKRLAPYGVDSDSFEYNSETKKSERAWSGLAAQHTGAPRWSEAAKRFDLQTKADRANGLAPDSLRNSLHFAPDPSTNPVSGANSPAPASVTPAQSSIWGQATGTTLAPQPAGAIGSGAKRSESGARPSDDVTGTSAGSLHFAPDQPSHAQYARESIDTHQTFPRGEGEFRESKRSEPATPPEAPCLTPPPASPTRSATGSDTSSTLPIGSPSPNGMPVIERGTSSLPLRQNTASIDPRPSNSSTSSPGSIDVDPTEADERAAIAEVPIPVPAPSFPAAGLSADVNTWPPDLRSRHALACEDLLRRLHGIVSDGKGRRVGPPGTTDAELIDRLVEVNRTVATWMRGLGPLPPLAL